MEDSVSLIRELHESGNWQGIVQLYENGFTEERLLWFQPDSQGLHFLQKNLLELGVQGVSSVGCGSGLLEWLINSSTGLPVIGYEIDQGWWESKYSPQKFWNEISCIDDPATLPQLNPKFALLFCYFNDSKSFEAYIDSFKGDYVILIGPDEKNKIRYCDPQPFQLQDHEHWRTHAVWRSKFLEAIVIYRRCILSFPL